MWRGPLAYGQATAERTLLTGSRSARTSPPDGVGEAALPGYVFMALIAEDLLLLLLDEESGKVAASDSAEVALGGAVLAELAILGAVTVDERTSRFRSPKVRVTGPVPEDRVLADAMDLVGEKQRTAQDLVGQARQGPGQDPRRPDGRPGHPRASRVPAARHAPAHPLARRRQQPTRRRCAESVARVVVQGTTPDARTGALVAVLSAIDRTHKVVDHEGMSRREVKKRAKEVAEGAWAATAVRDAIQATNAAVVAAVAASGAAVAASSG